MKEIAKNAHFSDDKIDAIDVDKGDNFFIPVLKEVLAVIKKPKSVCDVGCGNGAFTYFLKGVSGCKITGVDGSAYALQKASTLGFDSLFHVEDFSSDSLPFEDNSFDLVVSKDVLEHLLNPEVLVSEISRITKHKGHILVSVPNHFPIAGRFRLLINNTIDPFGYFPNSHRWDFPHIRFFNKSDFLLLMSRAGLTPMHCLTHHFPCVPKLGRLMTKGMRGRLARAYPDMYAEAYAWLFQKN